MWDVLLEEEDPARRKPPPDGAASSSEIEEEYRKYDILKPAQFVGSISDILKKFPEGLEILRVSVSLFMYVMYMYMYMWRAPGGTVHMDMCTKLSTSFVYFTFLHVHVYPCKLST